MTTLPELAQAYLAAKKAFQDDKTEENRMAFEAWQAILEEARNLVREKFSFDKGYTAAQQNQVRLENLGWKP